MFKIDLDGHLNDCDKKVWRNVLCLVNRRNVSDEEFKESWKWNRVLGRRVIYEDVIYLMRQNFKAQSEVESAVETNLDDFFAELHCYLQLVGCSSCEADYAGDLMTLESFKTRGLCSLIWLVSLRANDSRNYQSTFIDNFDGYRNPTDEVSDNLDKFSLT